MSLFAGRGKKRAWEVSTVLHSITAVFISLSYEPLSITADSLKQLERFVVLLYSRRDAFQSGTTEQRDKKTSENISPAQAVWI